MHALLIALSLFVGLATATPQQDYSVSQVPDWVEWIPMEELGPAQGVNGSAPGDAWLVDSQAKWNGEQLAEFIRVVRRFDNGAVLRDGSQIEIPFDPLFQTLELHKLELHRNGEAIDQIETARMEVVQRESELESLLYSGSLSLLIFLQDVHEGDVLDYSISLRGQNPAFERHLLYYFPTQYRSATGRLRRRILLPAEAEYYITHHGDSQAAPTERTLGDLRVLSWDLRDRPGLVFEGDEPSWFIAQPFVQVSDFKDWSEVVQWALPSYEPPRQLPAALDERVEALRSASPDDEGRVLAALRLVQDEIRYLGIELGQDSYLPTPPDEVFSRRFGDCKDKSLLLVTLLSALEIDAAPALVSTTSLGHVSDFHPSPTAFDHVIVRVRLAQGTFWVDPTQLFQRGPLEEVGRSSLGKALVISPDSTGLSEIPSPPDSSPEMTVHYGFELGEPPEMARLSVVTIHRREAADSMRATLSETDREQLARDFFNFYASYYPHLEEEGSPTFADDPVRNEIRVVEQYGIAELWTVGSDGESYAYLYPPDLDSFLSEPTTRKRSSPLGIDHPAHVRCEIRATIAEGWDIQAIRERYISAGIHLERTVGKVNDTLALTYDFRTLADHVAVEDVREHLEVLAEAQDSLSYYIEYDSWEDEPTHTRESDVVQVRYFDLSREEWSVLFIVAIVLLFVGALGGRLAFLLLRRLFRERPPPVTRAPSRRSTP